MGKRGPKPTPLGELIFWEGLWYWVFYHLRGIMPSYEKLSRDKEIRKLLRNELQELKELVPQDLVQEDWLALQKAQLERELRPKVSNSEPSTWRALVSARTADEVREAFQKSERWLNPRWQGRAYVQDLHDGALQFVQAKRDIYYPRRESGDEKRVVFFARAMAGISLGISPRTSIDRLRKMKHVRNCPCIHCDLKRWERIDEVRYKFFFKPSDGGADPSGPARKLKKTLARGRTSRDSVSKGKQVRRRT
jgi:hypothetical protein